MLRAELFGLYELKYKSFHDRLGNESLDTKDLID